MKALDKLTNKKVKIEVILTPDLTIVKEYAKALDRIRGSRTTTNTNLGGGTGGLVVEDNGQELLIRY